MIKKLLASVIVLVVPAAFTFLWDIYGEAQYLSSMLVIIPLMIYFAFRKIDMAFPLILFIALGCAGVTYAQDYDDYSSGLDDRSVFFDLAVSEALDDTVVAPTPRYNNGYRRESVYLDRVVIDNEPQGRALREWRRELLNPW